MIEKECKICGKIFEAKTKRRLYCDDCQKHSLEKSRRMQSRIIKNINTYKIKEDIITYTCDLCGKEHSAPKNILHEKLYVSGKSVFGWDNIEHLYCCEQHRNIDIRNHMSCKLCGKSLKDNDYDFNPNKFNVNAVYFCSEECKHKYNKDKAQQRKNSQVHICKNCGNKFTYTRKEQQFCSTKCENKFNEKHKKEQYITKRNKCPICGKLFYTHYKDMVEFSKNRNKTLVCSQECLDKA